MGSEVSPEFPNSFHVCCWHSDFVSVFFIALMTFAMAQGIYCHLLLRTWFARTSVCACFAFLSPARRRWSEGEKALASRELGWQQKASLEPKQLIKSAQSSRSYCYQFYEIVKGENSAIRVYIFPIFRDRKSSSTPSPTALDAVTICICECSRFYCKHTNSIWVHRVLATRTLLSK